MKRRPVQGLMAAALLVTSLWSASPAFASSRLGEEVKIDVSQPEVDKAGFDISADYAVWMVEGEKTITLYDLDDNSETQIGNKSSAKTSPRVDGNYVVWIDSRDGGTDVYMYDVSKKKESLVSSGSKVTQLEISGKNIVWDDKSDKGTDIYLYNITSGDVEQITNSGEASNPSVGDTYVAWQDERNGNYDIYTYNLKTKAEKAAVTAKGDQVNPSISEDVIIFEDQSGEYNQVSSYDIAKSKTIKLTDDSSNKSLPHIFDTDFVVIDNGDLYFGEATKTGKRKAASSIYDKLQPRIYDDYVLYAKKDKDSKIRLNLYDIDEKESIPLGEVSGEPSQPAAHDRYVVYISEGNRSDSVILYDVEKGTSKSITKVDASPSRPLVSNHYVVWYDDSEDALFSYNIAKGTTKQVTDEDDDQLPDEKLYKLDGDNLLWVNMDGRPELNVTNLDSGKDTEITTLKKDPLSIDLYGNFVTWVQEESSNKASVYLYDIDEEDDTQIRKNVQVKEAKLGDNFVVWSEYTDTTKPSWDIYSYDIDRGKTASLLRYNDRDQINPQTSRNMMLFEDNRLSPNSKTFYFELYDVEDGSYSDYSWDDEAEVEEATIGGNRLVWIDKRDDDPYVYTMAISDPRDDDDGEEPSNPDPEPEPGDYKEYGILGLMSDGTLSEKMNEAGFDDFVFVFYPGTSKEKTMSLSDAFKDMDNFADLFVSTDLNEINVRVYK
ncbi:hypothetical protein P9G84_26110 [Brevibacillus centrosporus]|uniref:hypothetical protein n=1 Tax=Brevibacillus centrosporus TaxID=54910 RepID=UPI000F09FF19|nr:hypothetical protein [Brevibacillus centrosporus]MEC2132375.1 hypothetical protein [Brevibacillus centrosporus]RNB65077.1 hypothetical protein EDM55_26230 [Brevibacillus centrosporus]GED32702.1 hypothetical protein BCE02nite_38430 [Brevibacillus centrosporus]